jgi:hypothetical protein
MAKTPTVKAGASVQDLKAAIGKPSRSQQRAARLLDGTEVFHEQGEALARRRELRAAGARVIYRKVRVGDEVVHAVKEVSP